jgi:hypothetical protein
MSETKQDSASVIGDEPTERKVFPQVVSLRIVQTSLHVGYNGQRF